MEVVETLEKVGEVAPLHLHQLAVAVQLDVLGEVLACRCSTLTTLVLHFT